jgi:ABC-type antimicrobial peptide transport system permease subunit
VFGLLGLMITALGIFGVTAYAVTQQTSEIGIRVALGAAPTQIFRSVVGRTAIALGVGLAVGLAGAWSLAGLVRTFLFQIEPHDPRLFAAAAATLMAIGLAASFLPARRASRVDPATVLRMD